MRKISFILLAAMFLGLVAPVFAQQSQYPVATVNTGNLNVRSGPGVEFGSMFTLPRGYGVMMLARNHAANWVLIQLTDGTRGWVNINYLYTNYRVSQLPIDETAESTPVVPTAQNNNFIGVNVRATPGDDAPVVGVLPALSSADLLGRSYNSSWAQVRLPDGTTGWVFAQNIVTSVPVRSLAPSDGSVVGPSLPPGISAPTTTRPPTSNTTNTGRQTYTVQRGDTLSAIAWRYNVNMYTLASLNGIYNLDRIYAGQRLVIP